MQRDRRQAAAGESIDCALSQPMRSKGSDECGCDAVHANQREAKMTVTAIGRVQLIDGVSVDEVDGCSACSWSEWRAAWGERAEARGSGARRRGQCGEVDRLGGAVAACDAGP